MTAINYIYDKSQVVVCMDTLSLDLDRKPYRYMSKMFPIPHLRSVICGTGNADLLLNWVNLVQKYIIAAADISYLSKITSQKLIELNQEYSIDLTSTIYQFGYSEIDNEFKGYVYRSKSNFLQEELMFSCFAKKPDVEFNFHEEIKEGLDKALINLVTKQKDVDDKKVGNRIGVGGEIQRIIMTKDRYQFDIIHRFLDYWDCFDEMLMNNNIRARMENR